MPIPTPSVIDQLMNTHGAITAEDLELVRPNMLLLDNPIRCGLASVPPLSYYFTAFETRKREIMGTDRSDMIDGSARHLLRNRDDMHLIAGLRNLPGREGGHRITREALALLADREILDKAAADARLSGFEVVPGDASSYVAHSGAGTYIASAVPGHYSLTFQPNNPDWDPESGQQGIDVPIGAYLPKNAGDLLGLDVFMSAASNAAQEHAIVLAHSGVTAISALTMPERIEAAAYRDAMATREARGWIAEMLLSCTRSHAANHPILVPGSMFQEEFHRLFGLRAVGASNGGATTLIETGPILPNEVPGEIMRELLNPVPPAGSDMGFVRAAVGPIALSDLTRSFARNQRRAQDAYINKRTNSFYVAAQTQFVSERGVAVALRMTLDNDGQRQLHVDTMPPLARLSTLMDAQDQSLFGETAGQTMTIMSAIESLRTNKGVMEALDAYRPLDRNTAHRALTDLKSMWHEMDRGTGRNITAQWHESDAPVNDHSSAANIALIERNLDAYPTWMERYLDARRERDPVLLAHPDAIAEQAAAEASKPLRFRYGHSAARATLAPEVYDRENDRVLGDAQVTGIRPVMGKRPIAIHDPASGAVMTHIAPTETRHAPKLGLRYQSLPENTPRVMNTDTHGAKMENTVNPSELKILAEAAIIDPVLRHLGVRPRGETPADVRKNFLDDFRAATGKNEEARRVGMGLLEAAANNLIVCNNPTVGQTFGQIADSFLERQKARDAEKTLTLQFGHGPLRGIEEFGNGVALSDLTDRVLQACGTAQQQIVLLETRNMVLHHPDARVSNAVSEAADQLAKNLAVDPDRGARHLALLNNSYRWTLDRRQAEELLSSSPAQDFMVVGSVDRPKIGARLVDIETARENHDLGLMGGVNRQTLQMILKTPGEIRVLPAEPSQGRIDADLLPVKPRYLSELKAPVGREETKVPEKPLPRTGTGLAAHFAEAHAR